MKLALLALLLPSLAAAEPTTVFVGGWGTPHPAYPSPVTRSPSACAKARREWTRWFNELHEAGVRTRTHKVELGGKMKKFVEAYKANAANGESAFFNNRITARQFQDQLTAQLRAAGLADSTLRCPSGFRRASGASTCEKGRAPNVQNTSPIGGRDVSVTVREPDPNGYGAQRKYVDISVCEFHGANTVACVSLVTDHHTEPRPGYVQMESGASAWAAEVDRQTDPNAPVRVYDSSNDQRSYGSVEELFDSWYSPLVYSCPPENLTQGSKAAENGNRPQWNTNADAGKTTPGATTGGAGTAPGGKNAGSGN